MLNHMQTKKTNLPCVSDEAYNSIIIQLSVGMIVLKVRMVVTYNHPFLQITAMFVFITIQFTVTLTVTYLMRPRIG